MPPRDGPAAGWAGPALRILRAALLVVLGGICTFAVGIAVLIAIIVFDKPDFDRAHPDYAQFVARFAAAQRALEAGERWAVIDLAPVNGGAWRTACLFGGYTSPVQRMEALGAVVNEADRRRLEKSVGLRIAPVEEFEVLIAFVDEAQRAHFVHFPEGVGPNGQHYEACVRRPRIKVTIDAESKAAPQLLTDD